MASEVGVCNLALSYLGDDATVSSIDPPEGSSQADHCATFYPIARDTLLEMYDWKFASKRDNPALMTTVYNQWAFMYAEPNDCMRVRAVLDDAAQSDYNTLSYQNTSNLIDLTTQAQNIGYTPQEFVTETYNGAKVILTNQENAIIRYTFKCTDTAKFSPLFTNALSMLLASMLAGPLIKGEEGRKISMSMYQSFFTLFGRAAESDASQRQTQPTQSVPWMANR